MDSFFMVEQEARDRAGLFIRFNGSAGIWRATAVADAGGWQADTLSEDYDLCLRTQLAGWRMVYVRDIVVPGEVPPTMHDYKVQQRRWGRGRGQVIRKMIPSLIRADLPPLVKVHALFDMLNIVTVPCLLLIGIMSPLLVFALAHEPSIRPMAISLGRVAGIVQVPLNGILLPYVILQALRPYARGVIGLASEALASVPPFLAIMMGLNLLMLIAAGRGLRGGDAIFHRTAKYSVPGEKAGRGTRAPKGTSHSLETWGEGLLAVYFAGALVFDAMVGAWLYAPFHSLLAIGFAAMFGATLARR